MAPPPKITLHHLNASPSNRIFWALEELVLEYNVRVYQRFPSLRAPSQLTEVSPYGKAPALTIDNTTIFESAYILHRLLALPSPHRDAVEQTPSDDSVNWSTFAEGSLMNLMQAELTVAATATAWERGMFGGQGEEGRRRVGEYGRWMTIEKYLSSRLGKYFSGTTQPGIADFMMFFPAWSMLRGGEEGVVCAWTGVKGVVGDGYGERAMERLRKEEDPQKSKI